MLTEVRMNEVADFGTMDGDVLALGEPALALLRARGRPRDPRDGCELRPGRRGMRDAAIVMLDLRGFTALSSRLSPTETVALLREYHRHVVPEIHRQGGTIDKYLGDGIVATFGAAFPSDTHAADAFRAAEAALAAVGSWNDARALQGAAAVEVNAAITAGPVLFGVTGDASRLEFTVIGDAVNLASKLEKHCKIVGRALLATAEAWDRAGAQGLQSEGAWRALPARNVAGVAVPLDLVARA